MADVTIPDDIVLPIADFADKKEQDLHKALTDYSNNITKSFSTLEGLTNDKVAGSAGDATAGFLDAKVDDSSIEVSSNKLQVKALGIAVGMIAADAVDKDKIAADVAGDGLGQNVSGALEVKVDDSTIETNTDILRVKDAGITLAKMANIATDKVIGRTTAATGVPEVLDLFDDDTMATATDTSLATSESIKAYVDNEIAGVGSLSNLVFCWSGVDSGVTDQHGMVTGWAEGNQTNIPSIDGATYDTHAELISAKGTTFRTLLHFQFTKISGISTVTIHSRIWADSTNSGAEAIMNVDIGGQSNTVKSVTSSTPSWVTTSTITVSGLSDGTVYDGIIQLRNEGVNDLSFCSAVTLIGS